MYVTCRRSRDRLHKPFLFFIKIDSRLDIAMSVCLSYEKSRALKFLRNNFKA